MEFTYPPVPAMVKIAVTIYFVLIVFTLASSVLLFRRRANLSILALLTSLGLGLISAGLLPQSPENFEWMNVGAMINSLLCGIGLSIAFFRIFGVQAAPLFLLLVFVAIMVAVMQPGFPVNKVARRMQCQNNVHNLMISLQNYASTNDGQMPPAGSQPDDLSWRVRLLPLMDQSALYRAYQRDKPWDDPANGEFTKIWIKVLSCPSNPNLNDSQGRYYTAYALMTGPGTAFDGPNPLTLDDIGQGKGLTQTLIIGEACGANIVWNEPRDIDVSQERPGVNLPGKTRGTSNGWLSTYHKDNVNIAFADGSVKSVSANIDPEVLKALVSVDPADRLKELPR